MHTTVVTCSKKLNHVSDFPTDINSAVKLKSAAQMNSVKTAINFDSNQPANRRTYIRQYLPHGSKQV